MALVVCFCLQLIIPQLTHASDRRRTPIVVAVEKARPAVVNIHGHKTVNGPAEDGTEVGPRRVNGMGTGVVVDPRGYIVTNHHVIDGVRRIQVTLHDRRTYVARLVARDPQTDLAVIKINPSTPLALVNVGTSSDLMTGEPVIAVGNAYGYHHTVTRGIISALNRTVEVTDSQKYYDLIQTDASINPGNSGGPLLNIDGEMIAINVAVRVGAQGIGFAIPVDKAMEVAANLMKIENTTGTWHGVIGDSLDRGDSCEFVVRGVRENSPADRAGLRPGDVIKAVKNIKVVRALDIERSLLGVRAGSEVPFHIQRDRENKRVDLIVSSRGSSPLLADRVADHRPTAATRYSTSTATSEAADEAWRRLGMRLTEATGTDLRSLDDRYKGGLRITSVRKSGLAAQHGFQPGDILVGVHIWETVSLDNLSYVLHNRELAESQDVKFYVVRGSKTHVGRMPIVQR